MVTMACECAACTRRVLDLKQNDLTGTIPSTVSAMTSLQYVRSTLLSRALVVVTMPALRRCGYRSLGLCDNDMAGPVPTLPASLL
jgi:hypothetical protein